MVIKKKCICFYFFFFAGKCEKPVCHIYSNVSNTINYYTNKQEQHLIYINKLKTSLVRSLPIGNFLTFPESGKVRFNFQQAMGRPGDNSSDRQWTEHSEPGVNNIVILNTK